MSKDSKPSRRKNEYAPEIDELLALSEIQLQSQIIEPLLRELGFTQVFDNSGLGEKGKDLIAIETNKFGKAKLYAIQIKKFKLSAKATAKSSLGLLLNQLRQMLEEPVRDPSTNTMRVPDAGVFITPYPIPARALEAFHQRTRDPLFRSLEIIHGSELLDLIRSLIPQALSRFFLESQYRLRIKQEVDRITESSAAFGLSSPLDLRTIYVDATVGRGTRSLEDIVKNSPREDIQATIENAEELTNQIADWSDSQLSNLRTEIRDAKARITKKIKNSEKKMQNSIEKIKRSYAKEMNEYRTEMDEYQKAMDKYGEDISAFGRKHHKKPEKPDVREPDARKMEADIGELQSEHRQYKNDTKEGREALLQFGRLLEPTREQVNGYLQELSELTDETTSTTRCTQIAQTGIALFPRVRHLLESEFIQEHWSTEIQEHSKNIEELHSNRDPSFRLPSSALTRIKTRIYVIGAPGAGKTTLLRRITQYIAEAEKETGELPLFMPLVEVDSSYEGLKKACLKVLTFYGYRETISEADKKLRILLQEGKLRLCLDGLDETGDRALQMMEAVDTFTQRHPDCQVILSSRDTFKLPEWESAFLVRLQPFFIPQLFEFVERWFSSQPSSQQGLKLWLEKNSSMLEAARTPLIAALLCSLYEGYEGHAKMPSTEVDLYKGRFELLLGRWESAKGIPPLPRDMRERYRHFLMAFGMDLHSREKRMENINRAVALAKVYTEPTMHQSPEELVEDCVRRGLLVRETTGGISFGHLTYQEYMAAEWLMANEPTAYVWNRLLTPWWRKTIEFYSALKMDMSVLIRESTKYQTTQESNDRLFDLLKLATLTPPSMIHRVAVPDGNAGRIKYDWSSKLAPPDII